MRKANGRYSNWSCADDVAVPPFGISKGWFDFKYQVSIGCGQALFDEVVMYVT